MPSAFHFDHHTETAATPIIELVQPVANLKPRLSSLVYTPGATAHDLIFMKALAQVFTTAAAAAAATTVVLDSASFVGDTIASGDYLVTEHSDGTYGYYLASGLATLTATIAALAKAVNSGAKVYIMGSISETYHQTFKFPVTNRLEQADYLSGLAECGYNIGTNATYSRTGLGDPAMLYSANGTNAGVLNRAAGRYVSF